MIEAQLLNENINFLPCMVVLSRAEASHHDIQIRNIDIKALRKYLFGHNDVFSETPKGYGLGKG